MAAWRRALGYGFLVWLIPFVVAFAVISLKESWRSLFESIMAVTVTAVTVMFALMYFRRSADRSVSQGMKLGLLWLVVSVVIDLPLMLSPPINYTPSEYAADVGLTYLIMPLVTVAVAAAADLGVNAASGNRE